MMKISVEKWCVSENLVELIGIFVNTQQNKTMGVSNIREELHQLINQADEETVNRIYELIKSDNDRLPLTPAQQRDLAERIKRDERGESKSYTWDETLELIKKRK